MKREFDNIENLFRESLTSYKIEPSKEIWKKIDLKLSFRDFFLPNFNKFNIYYLSAIAGLITTMTFLFSNDSNIIRKATKINENNVKIEKLDKPIEKKEEIINIPKKKKTITSYLTEVYTQKDFKIAKETQKSDLLPLPLKNNLNEFSKIYGDSLNIGAITVLPPKPLFTIDNKTGCAPFEINLKNRTQMAQYYEWTFGDGSKSTSANPSYTYQYPGTYTIKLKAIGSGGIAYCIIDSIVVYDSPKNKITWPYQNSIIEGQRLELNTESQNCVKYEWDFGDGNTSAFKRTVHQYQTSGKYSILLKSWSDKNCMDSVLVANINVVKLESLIAFPNAFWPNPSGPSSGRYTGVELHIDIFHPIVTKEIAEYEFKIFTKQGTLIFVSNDVQIGWDGYYHNQKMPEGVYPYIVKGKFEGGSSFIKKGNVTLLVNQ